MAMRNFFWNGSSDVHQLRMWCGLPDVSEFSPTHFITPQQMMHACLEGKALLQGYGPVARVQLCCRTILTHAFKSFLTHRKLKLSRLEITA